MKMLLKNLHLLSFNFRFSSFGHLKTAGNIVFSTITEASEFPSKVAGLAFCDGCWIIFTIVMCVKDTVGILTWVGVMKPITLPG